MTHFSVASAAHPLLLFPRQVLISSSTCKSLLQGMIESEFIIENIHFQFLLLSLRFSPSSSPIFVQGIIIDQGNDQELIVSEYFPFKEETECQCEIIRPGGLFIHDIILQPLDHTSLDYVSECETFYDQISNQQRGMVLGEGDLLTLSRIYMYKVVYSFPFKQGVFSPSHAPSTPQRFVVLPSVYEGKEKRLPDHLSASVIAPKALASSPFRRSVLSSGLGSLSLLPRNKVSSSIPIKPLIAKRLERSALQVEPAPKYRSPLHEAFVTIATLATLQIASGSWVLLKNESIDYVVRLYATHISMTPKHQVQQEFKDGRIYLPPLALFRLGLGAVQEFSKQRKKIQVLPFSNPLAPTRTTNKESPIDFPFQQAKKIVLARVRAPGSASHVSVREFGEFLKNPLFLCQGDIIPIPMKTLRYLDFGDLDHGGAASADQEIPNSQQSQLFDDLMDSLPLMEVNPCKEDAYIYFKVTKIHFSGATQNDFPSLKMAFAKKGCTGLAEVSSINTSIPMCYEDFKRQKTFLPPPGMKETFNQLLTVISPFFSNQQQISHMHCSILLYGIRGNGKRTVLRKVCHYLGIHLLEVNCLDLLGQGDTETTEGLRICFEQARKVLPCILLLRHVSALEKLASQQQRDPQIAGALREYISNDNQKDDKNAFKLITVATDSKLDNISSSTRSCFRHEIQVGVPEEFQRASVARHLLCVDHEEDMGYGRVLEKPISVKTAGYSLSDLQSLISRAYLQAFKCVTSVDKAPRPDEVNSAKLSLAESYFEEGFKILQKAHAEELGAPKIPNVLWDDVGGLVKAKKEILDTIQLPLEHPELFSHGVRQRSGVLLYGPPGTGKTLLAKAVATECSLNFMSVKGPELLNMYVGESEKNVRDVFEKARNAKPCVVFFDELDSLAPNRGQGSDSGGVMDRVVSQLLAELDGLQKAAEVFIIGATNRPDLLDSALLRPGRLDRLVYLGVCETVEEQLPILEALTRKFDLDPDVDLKKIAARCPNTFTGADFYALCSDTLLNAMKERIEALDKIQKLDTITEDQRQEAIEILQHENLNITHTHFLDALQSITPSVSRAELERYKQVKELFSNSS